jgi:hypothetical protein
LQASHQALPPARSSFRLSSRSSSCARLTASRSVTVLERAASARSCQSPPPRAARCRSRTGRRVGIAPAASRERRARRPWSQATLREKPALVRSRTWSRALFCPLSCNLQHGISRNFSLHVRPPRNFANFLGGRNEVGRTFLINTTHDQPRQQPRSVSPPV